MGYLITALIFVFIYKKLSKNRDTEFLMSSKRRYEIQNELTRQNKMIRGVK